MIDGKNDAGENSSPDKSSEQADDNSDLKQAMFTVSDAVLGAAILLAIGVYAGGWLDKQFHSTPWCSVGLALTGGIIGLGRMVMKAKSLEKMAAKAAPGKLPPALSNTDWDNDDWGVKRGEYSGRDAKREAANKKNAAEEKLNLENSANKTSGSNSPKTGESSRFRLPHEDFTDEQK